MPHGFLVLTGSRAGFHFTPTGDVFIAGRAADAALRFPPEQDLTVSAHHAEFTLRDGVWHVRDLASRNGTLVNDEPVQGPVPLRVGDRITFGVGGPTAELREALVESATQRVRAAVRRERRTWLAATGALIVLAVVLVLALRAGDRRRLEVWLEDRALLEARIDSLIAVNRNAEAALGDELSGLRRTLRESEARLQSLRDELAAATDHGRDDTELRQRLFAATAALRAQQLAAALDFDLIQRRNRAATAMVWVEYDDGSRVTGTAFAARADGVLLTNRHLVAGADGTLRHRRIAVRFADSDQAFPASLIAVDELHDLAALRVLNIIGGVPVVAGFNTRADTIAPGSPVALIGFPLGGEAGDPSRGARIARPLVSAGLVLRSDDATLEIQGLGAAGASGSPLFDGAGNVVGVLYGGRDDGHTILAVAPSAVQRFLARLQ